MNIDFSVFDKIDAFNAVGYAVPKKREAKVNFAGRVTAKAFTKGTVNSVVVTSVIIPEEVVAELGWKAGDSVGFRVEKMEGGTFAIAITKGGLMKLVGNTIKGAPTKALTVKSKGLLDFDTDGKRIAFTHRIREGRLELIYSTQAEADPVAETVEAPKAEPKRKREAKVEAPKVEAKPEPKQEGVRIEGIVHFPTRKPAFVDFTIRNVTEWFRMVENGNQFKKRSDTVRLIKEYEDRAKKGNQDAIEAMGKLAFAIYVKDEGIKPEDVTDGYEFNVQL